MTSGDSYRAGLEPMAAGLTAVYFVVFVSFLDTHAQMPILAPYSESLGATPFLIGLVVGTYSFFSIVGNGISGLSMDMAGWRPPLALGLLGASLSLLGYALVQSAEALLAVRALHGIAGGLLIPATLMAVSSLSGSDELRPRMARYGMLIGTAALFGPLFAGAVSSSFGYRAAYLGLAVLMLSCFLLVMAALRTMPGDGRPTRRREELCPLTFTPAIAMSFITAFAMMGATGTLVSYMPIHGSAIGMDDMAVGVGFAMFALAAIATQALWPRRIAPRLPPAAGCATGIMLACAALLALPATDSAPAFVASMGLFGLGFGTVFPNMLVLVHAGRPSCRGRIMAVFFVFYSLGVAIVPPLAGYLYEVEGLTPTSTALVVCLLALPAIAQMARREAAGAH